MKKLTKNQFIICSAIATVVTNIEQSDNESYAYDQRQSLHGLKWAAVLIGVSDKLIYDIVINKNIKGYQNLNKLTQKVYF